MQSGHCPHKAKDSALIPLDPSRFPQKYPEGPELLRSPLPVPSEEGNFLSRVVRPGIEDEQNVLHGTGNQRDSGKRSHSDHWWWLISLTPVPGSQGWEEFEFEATDLGSIMKCRLKTEGGLGGSVSPYTGAMYLFRLKFLLVVKE